jgi:hypothetical protein
MDLEEKIKFLTEKKRQLQSELSEKESELARRKKKHSETLKLAAGKKKKSSSVNQQEHMIQKVMLRVESLKHAVEDVDMELVDLNRQLEILKIKAHVNRWLNDERESLQRYERADYLRTELLNVLDLINNDRNHALEQLIHMINQFGKEKLEAAGLNLKDVLTRWKSVIIGNFEKDPNAIIQAIQIKRYNLWAETEAVVTGSNRFHKLEQQGPLKQPEVSSLIKNPAYEARRKIVDQAAHNARISVPVIQATKIHRGEKGQFGR